MEFLNQNMQNIIWLGVALVVLLILVAVWRKFSPRVSGGRRGQRLGVSEYYELDKDRRLVLVRRDQVEHLILIGGPQDIVIENGIGAARLATSQGTSTTAPDPSLSPAAPAAGTARPAPRSSIHVEKTLRREEPEL